MTDTLSSDDVGGEAMRAGIAPGSRHGESSPGTVFDVTPTA